MNIKITKVSVAQFKTDLANFSRGIGVSSCNTTFGCCAVRLPAPQGSMGSGLAIRIDLETGQQYSRTFEADGALWNFGNDEELILRQAPGPNRIAPENASFVNDIAASDGFFEDMATQFFKMAMQSGAMQPQWQVQAGTLAQARRTCSSKFIARNSMDTGTEGGCSFQNHRMRPSQHVRRRTRPRTKVFQARKPSH
jgi:hypothetical protein